MIFVLAWMLTFLTAAQELPGTNSFVELPGSVSLPLPSGWRVLGAPESFPVAVIDHNSGGRLLVFRTTLDENERIAGAADFHIAVNRVIDSVVLQMPDAILLTSLGNYARNRADFTVEFQTMDTLSGEAMYHRLAGILYRHPDGQQLLFSLWAQVQQAAYFGIHGNLEQMQSGFRYSGPQEEFVFAAAPSRMRWFVVLLIGIAAALVIMRQRRHYLETRPGAAVWKCPCGRINRVDQGSCRKCGRVREQVTVG